MASLQAAPLDTEAGLTALAEQTQISLDDKQASKNGKRNEMTRMALVQLRAGIAQNSPAQIEAALIQLSAFLDTEALRRQSEELLNQIQAERKAEDQKRLTEIQSTLDQAGKTIRTAKTPEDLDVILKKLAKLQSQRNEMLSSSEVSTGLNNVSQAIPFLNYWQDYLSSLQRGDREAACDALRSMSDMDSLSVTLVPRSEILRLMHGQSNPDLGPALVPSATLAATIISRIKSPDDLQAAVLELQKLKVEGDDDKETAAMIRRLVALEQALQDFRAGAATQIELIVPNVNDLPRVSNPIPAIQAQILVLVLPRHLDLPSEVKANPGESPGDFLKRIAVEAAAKGDYRLAAKAADTESYLRYGSQTREGESQAGLFVTGQNQEAAQQFALAVASYQRALAMPAAIVPAKVIGERLASIKADHPEEYRQGFDIYLTPQRPDVRSQMMMRAQMDQMRQGGRPMPPTLSVPPAAPQQTPASPASPTP